VAADQQLVGDLRAAAADLRRFRIRATIAR
jgi:hypothetical protein